MTTIRSYMSSVTRPVATVYLIENTAKVHPVRCRKTGTLLVFENAAAAVDIAYSVAKAVGQDGIAIIVVTDQGKNQIASVQFEDENGNVRSCTGSRFIELAAAECTIEYFDAYVTSDNVQREWNKVDGHEFDEPWFIDLPGNEKQLPYASRKYQTLPN